MFELENSSREVADIERGIQSVLDNHIYLIIGAGGASVMDCAKLIAFGSYHKDDIVKYLKDVFNYEGTKDESISKIISLFESFGINMFFQKDTTKEELKNIKISTSLSLDEIETIMYEFAK